MQLNVTHFVDKNEGRQGRTVNKSKLLILMCCKAALNYYLLKLVSINGAVDVLFDNM